MEARLYLIVLSQLHTHSECQVTHKEGNGQVEVDKVVHSSEQFLATQMMNKQTFKHKYSDNYSEYD